MRWAGWLGAGRQAQGVKGVARPDHSSLLTRDALSSVPPPLQSLNYAQAGASVRTCAYRLAPPVEKGQLPWVAASIATGGRPGLCGLACLSVALSRAAPRSAGCRVAAGRCCRRGDRHTEDRHMRQAGAVQV